MNLPFFDHIKKYINVKPIKMETARTIAKIKRQPSDAKQTLGELSLFIGGQETFKCKTLELPWINNAFQISCIPIGTYQVVPRTSSKFKKHFHVTEVPGRSWILIHAGNYHTDILGCILVGDKFQDINKDGYMDVTNSKNTLAKLLELAPDGFELQIS